MEEKVMTGDEIINNTTRGGGTKRLESLDVVRGIAAMMVIMSHLEGSADIEVPNLYSIFFMYFMIPCFFFVSGYLLSPKKNLAQSLYYRIGKILILYVILSYLSSYINVSFWKEVIHNPILLLTNLWDVFLDITIYADGFMCYLIVATIISLVIVHVCRKKEWLVFILSLCIAIIGYIFRYDGGCRVWSWDTGCVCQFFMIIGWLIKLHGDKIYAKIKNWIVVCVSGSLYFIAVICLFLFADYDWIAVNVALNTWGFLPITIPMIALGNTFIFSLSKLISGFKPLAYFGKHSLIYFYFASHAASIAGKVVNWFVNHSGWSLLLNNYFAAIYITIAACLIMVLPCLIIDKFLPFINGQFKMPEIKFSEKAKEGDLINSN